MSMGWDKLRTFYTVVQAGSFTHAGERLAISQSAVSRQILGLEESLRVSLFHRHARGLILTEQGEILYNTVREVFAKLAMTESLLTENKESPQGILKVTTTVAFGTLWLSPRLHLFMEAYPDIQVELILDDRELDLTRRDADVGIRIIPSRNPELIQRKLMSYGLYLYASRGYLEKREAPKKPQDLKSHSLIAFMNENGILPIEHINWLLNIGLPRGILHEPRLSVNSIHGILYAIQNGIGIGVLPEYIMSSLEKQTLNPDQELIRVLPNLQSPKAQAFYVYPEELRNSKRISVFRDFLISKISEDGFINSP